MNAFESINLIMDVIAALIISFLLLSFLFALGAGVFLGYKIWAKNRERQKKALDMVLLEIQLPRENEIKIDAAEQMFSAFSGIKGTKGRLWFLKVPDHIVFEIVAKTGDIRFYVSMPKKLQDMVEKQIHRA